MKIHLKKKDWILIIIIICVAGLAFLAHELSEARAQAR